MTVSTRPCPADLDKKAAELSDKHAKLVRECREIADTPPTMPAKLKDLALRSNREARDAVLGQLDTVNDQINERQPEPEPAKEKS